jgi:hypothetical protein
MSLIVSQIKRALYNWSRPEMSENSSNVDNNKSCGTDDITNDYYKYFVNSFSVKDSSWKGEKQTLDCLEKIMKTVDKHAFTVVKGYVQSGKSQLMIYYSAWVAHQHNMNIVIMLRNQTADIKSLSDKFRKFKNEKGIKNLEIINFSKYYNAMEFEDVVDKFNETKKVFIILGNSDQLSKLNKVTKNNKITPFVMCIDEFDLNDKIETSKFQKEFELVKTSGNIAHILGVTGTALPIMFKHVSKLTSEQIISLEAPLMYKGIQNITFTEIDIEKEEIIEETMLKMLKSKYAFYDKDNKKHPSILLIKDDRIKTNQIDLMNELYNNKKIQKNWALIVYNGDGIFVKLPQNKNIEIQKNESINSTLQKIKDLYQESIKYIAIISGDLANRGLSFVSTDYSWHLTHMIMCASNSSTGTNLMQYSRLCGCYNDDIPLEMFTSLDITHELFAYDNLQERCVEKCEDPLLDVEGLKLRLTKMKLDETCIVRRSIDTKVKAKFDKLSNYDKIMMGEKLDVNTVKEAVKYVKQELKEKVRVYVKESIQKMKFTEENIKKAKLQLKDKGYKSIRTIKPDKASLHKNPEHVTKDRKNAEVMIGNKNGYISLYIKSKEELSVGELFIFEAPQGIYLAKSGDIEDLENMFKNHYQLQF